MGEIKKFNMKIAFIGDSNCTLQNMLIFGIAESMFYDEKVLLLDLEFRGLKLENAFREEKHSFIKEEAYYEIKEGLDYLLYRCNQGIVSSQIIREGVTFINDKLAIVKSALRGDFIEYSENINRNIGLLLKEFEKNFSIILVKSDLGIFHKNIAFFDTCIKNVYHDNIYRNSVSKNREILKNDMFIIIGQALGDCDKEKIYINRNYRVNLENFGLLPYNSRVDMKMESGRLLDIFKEQGNGKIDSEFVCAVNKLVFLFKQWAERNI